MFIILGIIFLVNACHSQHAQINSNEISNEDYLQSEEEVHRQLDAINPSIIEDSKLKTVFYSRENFL